MSNLNWFLTASVFQAIGMFFDEFYFHHKRDIPLWERIGHPLDTLTVIAVFLAFKFIGPQLGTPNWLIGLIIFSCLFVTKDEWIHKSHCEAGEQWLHSLLFLIHPVQLFLAWYVWQESGFTYVHKLQLYLLSGFFMYQFIYWNFIIKQNKKVNNEFYNDLHENWYHSKNDSVALLRAEAKVKNPWVEKMINEKISNKKTEGIKILDVGCGAGLLTNFLATKGFHVSGIDLSESSLEVAKKYDKTNKVDYQKANAYQLPFENETFDVVACMDFLEHVEEPEKVIHEISRVLKPRGLFIFHTFNRNWLSHLIIIKGMEWLVRDVPKNLHVIELFIKPKEIKSYCQNAGLHNLQLTGIAPKIICKTFFKLLFKKQVDPDFSFQLKNSTILAYLGTSKKGNV